MAHTQTRTHSRTHTRTLAHTATKPPPTLNTTDVWSADIKACR